MHMKSATVLHLLSIGAGLVDAVALSDFRPAVTDLPSTCNRAYREQIAGCLTSDFQGGSGCSAPCVQGLLQINIDVASSCQNVNVASNSIIGIFLAGKGIRALCNIEVVTKTLGTTPAQAPTQATTPLPLSSSTAIATTPVTISTNTPKTTVATTSRSSSSISTSVSTSLTSIMTIPLTSTTTSPSTSSQTALAASQGVSTQPLPICANSGGGSPFDAAPGRDCIQSAADSLRLTSMSLLLVIGIMVMQLV